jgi:hypothetical protein
MMTVERAAAGVPSGSSGRDQSSWKEGHDGPANATPVGAGLAAAKEKGTSCMPRPRWSGVGGDDVDAC